MRLDFQILLRSAVALLATANLDIRHQSSCYNCLGQKYEPALTKKRFTLYANRFVQKMESVIEAVENSLSGTANFS